MAKIGRNDSCPCGSGKKYKKCCLNREKPLTMSDIYEDIDNLDKLSNSINSLLKKRDFEEALSVCSHLQKEYPAQIDGIARLAEVYEAMGDYAKAAGYYHKSAEFAAKNEGFDQESVDMYLEDAKRMESQQE